jgi:hypothetical protein
LISKAPDSPHEVVAPVAGLVVDVAGVGGTGEAVSVDDRGALAPGDVARFDVAEVVGGGIGVSHDPC